MNLLLHACCAPCSIMCVQSLEDEGVRPEILWYNPNIHPLKEYKTRRLALREFCAAEGLKFSCEGEYGLKAFLKNTLPDPYEKIKRCEFCYKSRLEFTAMYAANNGYTHFSTTLLISPYQNHEMIRDLGMQAGKTAGAEFLYRDFRPLFRDGQNAAREKGIYMQKYCGCIFSEEERYS